MRLYLYTMYATNPTPGAPNARSRRKKPVLDPSSAPLRPCGRHAAAAFAIGLALIAPVSAATPPTPAPTPSLLLVNSDKHPRFTLSWTQTNGERVELAGSFPYGADIDRVALGSNIEAYIAVGGTRLGKGAGHPKGAIVRVGFYKVSAPGPFFEDIKPGTNVDVTLTGVALNQPAKPMPDTALMHLKYNPNDLVSCGLPPGAFECFNLASEIDMLNDRIEPGKDARLGVLGPDSTVGASSDARLEDDQTVTLTASVPYALFRNPQDPWESDLPGTFLEPIHFHVEVEVLPQGVEPLDIEARRERIQRVRDQLDQLD